MCRSHEMGESTRGGYSGVWGASPEKIFEFLALLCAFLTGFVCVWDQILVVLVTRYFWTKLFSDSHMFFFTFFSSACFFDIISSMSLQVLAKYL